MSVVDHRHEREETAALTAALDSSLAEDLRETAEERAILCVTGSSSLAAQSALAAAVAADRAVWVRPQPARDRGPLVSALYAGLGLERCEPRPRALSSSAGLIAGELQRSPRLVVVLDAEQLPTAALEWLYWLWAHGVPRRFPLVLSGDSRLDRVLRRPALASLNSCVLLRRRLPDTPDTTATDAADALAVTAAPATPTSAADPVDGSEA